MKAIVAGGGIGGLASAIALTQAGWSVTVIEQAKCINAVGAGIQISPNGCHVLAALGVLDDVQSKAFFPQALEMRFGKSGRQVFNIPLQKHSLNRWGNHYLHVHRAHLIDALLQRLEQVSPNCIQLGETVGGYKNHENSVVVTTNQGEIDADLLIGADGIHSAVRAHMHGAEAARFTGNVAWRAVIPASELGGQLPPPTACVWVGDKRHAVTYRLDGGKLVNFVGVVEQSDWTTESWTERGDRKMLGEDFQGWHPTITNIIANANDVYRWALFDRAPLGSWNDGRVTLLGDACHPMLPFQAQGASCALEDAWALSSSLQRHNLPEALDRYYQSRFNRASKIQQAARDNMRRFHHGNPLAYAPMFIAGRLLPWYVHARQDWIYGYNATQQ